MEKIKRLFKKILRTILIWSAIAALLLLQINASYIETILNPPNILLGTRIQSSSTQDNDNYHVYPYTFDYQGEISTEVHTIFQDAQNAVLGFWHSRLYADTFYKFVVNVEINQSNGEELETGKVVINNITQWLQIIPDELFMQIDSKYANMGVLQTATMLRQPLINDDYYTMFYDATSNQLSGIFYLPQSYFDLYPENQQHVYIMIGLGNLLNVTTKITVSQYLGTTPDGVYTDILNQINNKLENLAASGGGLTEEQVSAAVEEALKNHDESQKNEFEEQLNNAQSQIYGELQDFQLAAANIYMSLTGVTNSLRYSGTDSILTLPEARNPLANNALLWSRQTVDLAGAWLSLPQTLRSAISVILSLLILLAVVKEVIDIIRWLLGIGGASDD